MLPRIGDIVHYVSERGHEAALVTGVSAVRTSDIYLTIFPLAGWLGSGLPYSANLVAHDEFDKVVGTWHWPEVVDDGLGGNHSAASDDGEGGAPVAVH